MGTTQPIRKKEALKAFMDYYRTERPVARNYALIVLGLHTALRISDILNLKWEDIYDYDLQHYREHLSLVEHKTGKHTLIAINAQVIAAFEPFRQERAAACSGDYIFTKNTCYQTPLCRSQAFRIIKHAAEETLHTGNVSCHSLRKTFGYHAWKQGTPPALLMDIYNHSSYQVTKKYLGIEQDERDSIFMEIQF